MSFDWLRRVRQGWLSVTRSSSLQRPRARRGELPSEVPALVQRLEPRVLLSVTPVGLEFQVNTFTTGTQRTFVESPQSVAMDADGDFVVTWSSNGQDGSGYGVYAQRYNSAGVAQGSEFRVNTHTTNDQRNATVAMDADGDFVVTWTSNGQDGSGNGIYAQRYSAAGVAQGSEFRVNTVTTNGQRWSTVAMDSGGDFVVTWASYLQDGSHYGVYAKRYNAAGVAQGGEISVNTHTTSIQNQPVVDMDANGDFVVTWMSYLQDGSNYGVYAQRFNAAGVAQGTELQVNSYTTSVQRYSTVAMDADGDFVVTWSSLGEDGDGYGVYAQRYNAVGVAQGTAFRVHTFTTHFQRYSMAAMDADGDFVIAWSSTVQDGGTYGVYAQRYNAAGVAQGSEFRVNTFVTDNQRNSRIAMDADGDFVVAWSSFGQDGDLYGVYAQRYDDLGPDDADNAGPTVTDVLVNGYTHVPNAQLLAPPSSLTVVFSEELSTTGGAAGANSVTNRANWRLMKNSVDVSSALISGVSFGYKTSTGKYETVVYFTTPLTSGDYLLTAKATMADAFGNALDGNADGTPGGDYTRAFRVRTPQKKGNEFQVNTFTTGAQRTFSQSPHAVAMDADGDFVVTWSSGSYAGAGQDGSGFGVYAQRYNAAGVAQGSEFLVNAFTTDNQVRSSVAMDANGDFVITWTSKGQDGSGYGIYARRYNAAGAAQGSEFLVNTFTTSDQAASTVAMDADGDFVITWTDGTFAVGQDGSASGIYAQRYNAAGVAQGGEFRVNTFTPQIQHISSVAMDADGDFVIIWSSRYQDGSLYGTYAQRYNAAGVAQGSEFRVNTFTTLNQRFATVAMDADGDFVVTWSSQYQDGDRYEVYAQRYNKAGVAQGGEFRVNTFTMDFQRFSKVAMDADGDFVITWDSFTQDGSEYGVYAQRYNAMGFAQGSEFRVNTFIADEQRLPSVAMDADGDFVVAWTSLNQDGSDDGVYAQRYGGGTTPTASNIAPVINEDTPLIGGLLWAFDPETPIDQLTYTITSPTTHGTVVKTGVRGFNYTPQANYNGMDSFQFTVSDGELVSAPATVSITINPVNDTPTAFPINPVINEDTPLNGGLLWASDPETPIDSLIYTIITPAAHGTVTKVGVRGFNYVPQLDYNGMDSFQFTASDGLNTSAPATVSITINPVAGVPHPSDAKVSTKVDTALGGGLMGSVDVDTPLNNWTATSTSHTPLGPLMPSSVSEFSAAPAVTPVGLEFQVNTLTTNAQRTFADSPQSVAMDADGDFIVTWSSLLQDGSGYGVYAQRYNTTGVAQGSEFRVNTFTTGDQKHATVAMDTDGDFVVTWTSTGQDGSSYGIYAQRYNAAGVAQGSEFRVNTFTPSFQRYSTVAMDADGDFVVTWSSYTQDGSGYGIYARRYNAAGVAQGGEIPVNTFTNDSQLYSTVAMDADGDFVITWSSYTQDGDSNGVYAQRYNAAGVAQGIQLPVNTFTTGNQWRSTVAMDADGDFVITWSSFGQDGSSYGIFAQRYNAAGVAQGSEFPVNAFTTGIQRDSTVAMDADGDFVVTWTSDGQDGSSDGVFGQRYNSAGVAQGSDFCVNVFTSGLQFASTVAMDDDGDFVVAWTSNGQDGSSHGVYAQRYDDVGPDDADNAGPTVTDVLVNGYPHVPNAQLMSPPSSVTVVFSEELSAIGGAAGANSVTNPANWRLLKNGVDVSSSLIGGVSFGFKPSTGKYEAVVYFTTPLTPADYVLIAKGMSAITDVFGNTLDGNADGTSGDDYTRAFKVRTQQKKGSEFRVNTYTTGNQTLFLDAPGAVALDANGNFVITWTSKDQDGNFGGVYVQRYNASGVAQGSELRVNTVTTGSQDASRVAMDADGDFVITWTDSGQDGSGAGVYAQRYNAVGVAQGGEFRVNSFTAGNQLQSKAAMDGDGDFVVTWTSKNQDSNGYGMYAQRYNAMGVAQGGEFRVNSYTFSDQFRSSVAMDADGDFVVVWTSNQDGDGYGVYAQRYNAAGVAQGGEFRVNTFTANGQQYPTVAMDGDGDFVVSWMSFGQEGSTQGIYAQRYNAAGIPLGTEFRVNTVTTDQQSFPAAAMDSDGDFVVTWRSKNQDGSAYGVYAQRYNAVGVAQGGEFQVNTYTTNDQHSSAVAMDADGDFVVAWSSFEQDSSSYGVYAQRYGGGTTPTASNIAPVTNEDTPIIGGLLWAFDPETPIDQLTYTIGPAAHGSVTKTGVRSFNYTPQANYFGPDSFLFTVSDGELISSPGTVSITVAAVNDTPTASNLAVQTNEDTSIVGGLLWAFDVETPLNSLTYTITSPTTHGTVTKTGVRSFNYVPQANYNGPDSFQFTVSDGLATSTPATVNITVNAINDTPQAFDASASTNEDTPLNGGLMWGSDVETPTNSLTFTITNPTTHGSVTKVGVRGFNYVPVADFNGTDTFQYTVSDGQATSAPATMTITVNPVAGVPAFDPSTVAWLPTDYSTRAEASDGLFAASTPQARPRRKSPLV